ncbi:hypothetical protein [Candidatus Enterococcus lemimoniae]|uniref:Uncharacterized protein n=1 Tax=Candidatus Enterococcus lemimoniae TaxID=1834167 RepID=A0ABZ2T468_9ENTE|nr:hypothetical protein [Enterococcus sp. 12C11_DIV0727]OTO68572.1 hypothetical protein A5866_000770 [Enterococcus sp. 12C11_DIV0727]
MENSIINTVDFIEEYFETSKFYIIKTKKYGIFTFNNNKITLIQLVDKSAINKVKYVLNELGYSESKSYISNHDEIKGLTKKIFTTGMSIR